MSEFKVGDRVRVVSGTMQGSEGEVTLIQVGIHRVDIGGGNFGIPSSDLELVEPVVLATTEGEPWNGREPPEHTVVGHPEGVLEVVEAGWQDIKGPTPPIRTFDTGATRDTDQGKLDYIKALSPIVLRRYVQYLDKHRKQSDGSYRGFDNWKKGIPKEAYVSGSGRHFLDTWLLTEGYATEDNHGPVELEDAICAQLFNLMGRLHEMLKTDRTAPTEGGY